MNEELNYGVGDIVKLRKTHLCDNGQREILRMGAGFRLRCMGYGHQTTIVCRLVEKDTRELTRAEEDS